MHRKFLGSASRPERECFLALSIQDFQCQQALFASRRHGPTFIPTDSIILWPKIGQADFVVHFALVRRFGGSAVRRFASNTGRDGAGILPAAERLPVSMPTRLENAQGQSRIDRSPQVTATEARPSFKAISPKSVIHGDSSH